MTRERVAPHDLDAERAVLGAILIRHELLSLVLSTLEPDDFYRRAHTVIYAAMLDLAKVRVPIDLLTLMDALQREGQLALCGGPAYLASMTDGIPTSTNIEAYGKIVREKAVLRRIIKTSTDLASRAYEAQDAREIVSEATQILYDATMSRAERRLEPIGRTLARVLERGEDVRRSEHKLLGVPTGFDKLDMLTSGFRGGQLIIVASRPGAGKSSFAMMCAYNVAGSTKQGVALFSLEMTKDEIGQRLMAAVAQVNGHRLLRGALLDIEFKAIADKMDEMSTVRFYVDDSPRLSVMMLRAKCLLLKAQQGLAMLVVDYLQLMPGDARQDNRNLQIAEISRALKELANEFNVPVVALSQLSRAGEKRSNGEPILSDLRESGALEQDADIVLFLHRAELVKKTDENSGKCKVILGKHRAGPLGSFELGFDAPSTRFYNLSSAEMFEA